MIFGVKIQMSFITTVFIYIPLCVFLFLHHRLPFALQSKIVQAKFEPSAEIIF